jgi:hypothetical protein
VQLLRRESLARQAEWAREGDERSFVGALEDELRRGPDPEAAERLKQAAPPEQLWLGLERYWRKRAEREQAGAAGAGRPG